MTEKPNFWDKSAPNYMSYWSYIFYGPTGKPAERPVVIPNRAMRRAANKKAAA